MRFVTQDYYKHYNQHCNNHYNYHYVIVIVIVIILIISIIIIIIVIFILNIFFINYAFQCQSNKEKLFKLKIPSTEQKKPLKFRIVEINRSHSSFRIDVNQIVKNSET